MTTWLRFQKAAQGAIFKMAAPMNLLDLAIEEKDYEFIHLLLDNAPLPKRITYITAPLPKRITHNTKWPRFKLETFTDTGNQCLDKFRF